MIKKFFNKIYNFIQWTKKWHFFHFFINGTTLIILFLVTAFFLFIYTYINNPTIICINSNRRNNADDNFILFIFFEHAFATFCTGIIGLFVEIIFLLRKLLINKKCCITSKFLLCNKFYNIYYILSFLSTIFSWIICFYLYFFYA